MNATEDAGRRPIRRALVSVYDKTGLAELARAHLVNEHRPGRYTLHDLLRAYAAELGRNGSQPS